MANELIITSAEMIEEKDLDDIAVPGDFEVLSDKQNLNEQSDEGGVTWIFQDGEWVQVKGDGGGIIPEDKPEPEVIEQEISELVIPEEEIVRDEIIVQGEDSQSQNDQQQRISDLEAIREPIVQDDNSRIEWVFQDGKWVPVQVGYKNEDMPATAKEEKSEESREIPENLEWDKIGEGGVQTRLIKIPVDRLFGGDSRYNVIVKPGDTIHVPVDIIGEYYIGGNVNNRGIRDLTGRPMTLKMAINAAGGLAPLAWPKRCEIIRRLSKNKEEIVMVDLDKIYKGEQPDFFIKPNDVINVGTHPTAMWRAVLRNSFRASYGFGFVYDRNFADRDYGTSRPIPGWLSSIF